MIANTKKINRNNGKNLIIIGIIYNKTWKSVFSFVKNRKLKVSVKLLLEITLKRPAILKILPIWAKLLAPSVIGSQKNTKARIMRNESRLFHLSAKKFYGPIAIILKISSTMKIQTKTSSMVPETYQTS